MKETGTAHWASPNTGATNSSGFTALPGGLRHYTGTFFNLTGFGYFWSASEFAATNAWYRYLCYSNVSVGSLNNSKSAGFSARCLQD